MYFFYIKGCNTAIKHKKSKHTTLHSLSVVFKLSIIKLLFISSYIYTRQLIERNTFSMVILKIQIHDDELFSLNCIYFKMANQWQACKYGIWKKT